MHGNGYIAYPELEKIMTSLGEGMSAAEVTGMEKASGKDAENQVNIRHFVDVLHANY